MRLRLQRPISIGTESKKDFFIIIIFCMALSINEESSNYHMTLHYKVLCPKLEFCFGLTEDHNGETELPKSSQEDTHRLSILLDGGTVSVITKGTEAL